MQTDHGVFQVMDINKAIRFYTERLAFNSIFVV